MKRIIILLLMSGLIAACHKNSVEIKGSRDLKNLPLQELKNFLNGKWRLQYTINFTIAGRDSIPMYSSKSYTIFYPVDSVTQINEKTGERMNGKVAYKKTEDLPGSGGIAANILILPYNIFDLDQLWVADTLINDTLVFANYFQSEGINRHYFTREQ
jgi:hypothetical protein